MIYVRLNDDLLIFKIFDLHQLYSCSDLFFPMTLILIGSYDLWNAPELTMGSSLRGTCYESMCFGVVEV